MLRNEYLAAENEILKSKFDKRLQLTKAERVRLAKIGKRLGRKALAEVGCIVKPDTLLKWFRELVAKKFDGSKKRRSPGRPRVDPEIERLVLRFAEENPTYVKLGHMCTGEIGSPPAHARRRPRQRVDVST